MSVNKERGIWLSIWLALIMLHSFISALIIYMIRRGPSDVSVPWLLAILFLASAIKLISAIAIWNWKRWGLYLYAGGVIATMVVGLMLTGSLLVVFSDILPLAVLGWLIKDKYSYFS